MSAYKLVVVDPFENYKRGDQIIDPKIVKNICDDTHDMHHYDRHVRRVMMSEIEKQQYIVPSPENIPPEPAKENIEKLKSIKINSIKAIDAA